MTHLVVWREKEGNALRTYAGGDAQEAQLFEAEGRAVEFVDGPKLEELVSSRQVFSKVAVAPEVARSVLGWDV